ncbi:GNAT family N-acetyltransferase [Herbiconiux sp. 11R-BC]|uniref:GNAT family N-acetyltransferase n=1 Tax=Herbiconiux sp. 11R-BC TaxID=3111637 RepID=UPI003C092289
MIERWNGALSGRAPGAAGSGSAPSPAAPSAGAPSPAAPTSPTTAAPSTGAPSPATPTSPTTAAPSTGAPSPATPITAARALPEPGTSELAALLTAYHLATEAEKGSGVTSAAALPPRCRAEIDDPARAFAGCVVLLARDSPTDPASGVVIVTGPTGRPASCEVKRLWVDPGHRGRGLATRLLEAAIGEAAASGAERVRLSVWRWRLPAIALYGRLGFVETASWDDRADLLCLERPLAPLDRTADAHAG